MSTSDCGWGGRSSHASTKPSPKRLINVSLRLAM
jgi:hypothetical protein